MIILHFNVGCCWPTMLPPFARGLRAYKRLGLLELRAFGCLHQLKKRWHIVKGGKVVN